MTQRDFDPCRLDVSAFAKQSARLEGRWSLAQFERLVDVAVADASAIEPREIVWSAQGEQRLARGSEVQVWMRVTATACLPLECQRCLKPVNVVLDVDRRFLFVHGEDTATRMDANSEDDVFALTRALDLRELIEDELLLALPLVPRHEACPHPLNVARDESSASEKPNPFAVLEALKQPDSN